MAAATGAASAAGTGIADKEAFSVFVFDVIDAAFGETPLDIFCHYKLYSVAFQCHVVFFYFIVEGQSVLYSTAGYSSNEDSKRKVRLAFLFQQCFSALLQLFSVTSIIYMHLFLFFYNFKTLKTLNLL